MPFVRPMLVALALATAVPLHAQSALHTHLDPARLRAARDSFALIAQGTERGWEILGTSRDGDGWLVSDALSIGGMVAQQSSIRLGRDLRERQLRQSGSMRGQAMAISLDMADGRVKGTALTPSGGPSPVPIDTLFADGLVDDNAVTPLLAAVRWTDTFDATVPVFLSGKGTVSTFRLRTLGSEAVTVPAGRFDAWKVELSTPDGATVVAHVTKAAPYRVVRIQLGPALSAQFVR